METGSKFISKSIIMKPKVAYEHEVEFNYKFRAIVYSLQWSHKVELIFEYDGIHLINLIKE